MSTTELRALFARLIRFASASLLFASTAHAQVLEPHPEAPKAN